MSERELDWALLDDRTQTKRVRHRFEEVKHAVKKVAFDVFKSTNGDQLWELRSDPDGTKYLYAIYGEPAEITTTSSDTNGWKATPDSAGKNVTLSFKNLPLIRFASAEHGFEPDEAADFAHFLQSKVQDPAYVAKMAEKLPEPKRQLLAAALSGSET